MKTETVVKLALFAVLAVAIALSGCKNISPTGNEKPTTEEPIPVKSISMSKSSMTLTLYSTEQLTPTFNPPNATNKEITWTSSAPNVVSVDANGKITAVSVTNNLTAQYTVTPATGTADITAKTEDGGKTATITVTTTLRPQTAAVDSLPPMKDQFKDYFMMGNIARSAYDINGTEIMATRLKRHYDILTAENVMKPDSYGGSRSGQTVTGLTYKNSDNFVKACADNGFKVHGHVLLWHSQNPKWITDISGDIKADALTVMKNYITQVMEHFKGKIYSWDVLNEVFPDSVSASADWTKSMRTTGDSQAPNPWYVSIGSDFVYEGFLAARLADPGAILYYNDYNTDQVGKATMIRNMVKAVNDKYLALPSSSKPAGDPAGRLLIEGIGMQEHHNTNVSTVSIKNTIALFRPLGVKISVSELDVLCQGWSEFSSNPAKNGEPETSTNTVTNQGFIKAAQLYGEYMKLYMDNKDIIERVALWGVIDSQSWRGKGLPLIFDKDGKAKPAYYKMIGALEQ
jgi:endo-1,4-beta-xylanase